MEAVVLHRVGFLEYFCPKQGKDFKPSAAPIYPNMGELPPPPPPRPGEPAMKLQPKLRSRTAKWERNFHQDTAEDKRKIYRRGETWFDNFVSEKRNRFQRWPFALIEATNSCIKCNDASVTFLFWICNTERNHEWFIIHFPSSIAHNPFDYINLTNDKSAL